MTVEWSTPKWIFDALNKEFSFTIDVAATASNAKLPRYFTEKEDGLSYSWEGERVFCNPPYGRVIGNWVQKLAASEAELCVGVLPARTDTRWFHEFIIGKAEIRFIRGRLKFGDSKNSAPFPSMICVWDRDSQGLPALRSFGGDVADEQRGQGVRYSACTLLGPG